MLWKEFILGIVCVFFVNEILTVTTESYGKQKLVILQTRHFFFQEEQI